MKTLKLFLGSMLAVIAIVGIATAVMVETSIEATATAQTCPAGSYDIGISKDGSPICKLEPTGCPYGDSIPMDMCAKFAPQTLPATTPEPIEAEPVEMVGK